ncbi:hypothetical protein [Dongia sedimenti]|uniref:Uncharacterized protein n=1 Tax=Dongia sedimenti TaxID=3064282 RepID=A0ABU0YT50_9PROT|nr:hypothetical protein [Rhodospirillaceae bacterium R-7]
MNRGIYLISASIVAGCLFGWYLETEALKVREFRVDGSGVSQQVEIKPVVSPLSAQSEFVGRAKVANTGTAALAVGDLVAHDQDNWHLPLQNVVFYSHPDEVQANTVAEFNRISVGSLRHDWRPKGSIEQFVNSHSRLHDGRVEDYIRHRWNGVNNGPSGSSPIGSLRTPPMAQQRC